MVAEVIINSKAKQLNRTFDYNIPKEMENIILVGSKVLVPFGRFKKLEEAHVVKIKEKSEYEIKNIAKVENGLTNNQIELANWMAKRYFCNVSDCIRLMQTPGTNAKDINKRIQDKKISVVYLKKNFEEINFEIERKKITTNPVIEEKLEDNIGYLQISSFDDDTAEDFKTKYEDLKNQGITSLIIDLRNNGGGLVDEALEIADYIVPKGKDLLVTVDKNQNEEIRKSKEDPIIDMDIVVLVNENTASASEILAGCLKDHQEATIVGTKTYGKGVIQQVISLKNGAGLKVTVEEYYTPNKTKINKVGIEPDETVNLPENVNALLVKREQDTQLQKSIEKLK